MSRTLAVGLILVSGMAVREAFAQQEEEEKRRAARAALVEAQVQMRAQAMAVIVRQRWTDEQFDRWVFQQHDRAAARQWFDSQLTIQIERIDQAYGLTEAQKQKLRLAGRGDIKRFFDRYESVKQKFQLIEQDAQKLQAIWQDVQPLQAAVSDLFQGDSLLFKSLPNTLTAEQLARYEALARERRAFAQVRLLEGHQGEGWRAWVTRIAVAPDGRQLVTVGGDAVRFWDAETGKAIRVFGENQSGHWSVAFSRDGRRIVAGSNDHSARVWDTDTGKELQRYRGHTAAIWGVAFSADGRQLLTGAWDQSIRVWDVQTGKQLRLFDGVHDNIRCLSCSPDGKLVAAGHFADHNQPGILRLWDLSQGKEIRI
jgi:WD40 repeat protein